MDDFVLLCDCAKSFIVKLGEVVSFESAGNYTNVTLLDSRISIRKPLQECERRLDSTFFRVSRTCIVNLGYVEKVESYDAKRFVFVLKDGRDVVLSRKQSLVLRRDRSL